MNKRRKPSVGIGVFGIVSLVSAVLFCFGCSTHEYGRQGQAQDAVTHLLAGGTYLSLLSFVFSSIAFVAVLLKKI